MSLEEDAVWSGGVWAPTVWAEGVWFEGTQWSIERSRAGKKPWNWIEIAVDRCTHEWGDGVGVTPISSSDIIGSASADELFADQSGYTVQVINTFTAAASVPETGIHGTPLPETTRFGKVADPADALLDCFQFQVASVDPDTSGGKRAELRMDNNIEWGETYWLVFDVYVKDWGTLATNDTALFGCQMHSGDDGAGLSPSFGIYTQQSGRHFNIQARYSLSGSPSEANTVTTEYTDYPIPFGEWINFVFKFKHNVTGSGLLRVWMNGSQIVNYLGYLGFVTGIDDYAKFGYYNWGTMNTTARKVFMRSPKVIHDPTGSTYTLTQIQTGLVQSPTEVGCPAVLGVDASDKCYNSWETCPVRDSFSPADYWVRFGEPIADIPRAFSFNDDGLPFFLPLLKDFKHDPTLVDPGESLGVRVRFTAALSDAPHHDLGIDKYARERATGDAGIALSGIATDRTVTSLTLSVGAVIDDFYVGAPLRLSAGAGSVQSRTITDYDGTNRIATVSPRWSTNLLLHSSTLSHSDWVKVGTVSANGEWWTINDTSAVNLGEIYQDTSSPSPNADYIASVRVRKNTGSPNYANAVLLSIYFAPTVLNYDVVLDINTGEILGKNFAAGSPTVCGVEDETDCWRLWVKGITYGSPDNTTLRVLFYPAVGPLPLASAYDAASTGAVDIKDFQLENADSLGDYIETIGSLIEFPIAGNTEFQIGGVFDPHSRGTMLRKLKARYPHYVGRKLRWYQGYVTDTPALTDFRRRDYVMERFEGPNPKGEVRIIANDPLRLLDDDRSVVPVKSTGELAVALDETTLYTQIDITTSDLTEYDQDPASFGYVRIEDEIFTYTGTTVLGAASVRLTGVTRAAPSPYETEKAEHDVGSLVQRCELLSGTVAEVVETLMVDFAGVDPSYIPTSDWTNEATTWAPEEISRLITDPEGVRSVVNEIIGQTLTWGFWWDEINQEIRYSAMRPPDIEETVFSVTDENIVAGSVDIVDIPDATINEIHVLYGQIDPTLRETDVENYRRGYVAIDEDSQSDNELGQRRIKKIYGRWHSTFNSGVVAQLADRLLNHRSKNLVEVRFSLERKDENFGTAEFCDFTSIYILNALGLPATVRMRAIQVNSEGEEVAYRAREEFFRFLFVRLAPELTSGSPAEPLLWADATQGEKDAYMFLANEEGKFSDGTQGKALA